MIETFSCRSAVGRRTVCRERGGMRACRHTNTSTHTCDQKKKGGEIMTKQRVRNSSRAHWVAQFQEVRTSEKTKNLTLGETENSLSSRPRIRLFVLFYIRTTLAAHKVIRTIVRATPLETQQSFAPTSAASASPVLPLQPRRLPLLQQHALSRLPAPGTHRHTKETLWGGRGKRGEGERGRSINKPTTLW